MVLLSVEAVLDATSVVSEALAVPEATSVVSDAFAVPEAVSPVRIQLSTSFLEVLVSTTVISPVSKSLLEAEFAGLTLVSSNGSE